MLHERAAISRAHQQVNSFRESPQPTNPLWIWQVWEYYLSLPIHPNPRGEKLDTRKLKGPGGSPYPQALRRSFIKRANPITTQPAIKRRICQRCTRNRIVHLWVISPGGKALDLCRSCWLLEARREEIERIKRILFKSSPPPNKSGGCEIESPCLVMDLVERRAA
jgi:hypothetical protein